MYSVFFKGILNVSTTYYHINHNGGDRGIYVARSVTPPRGTLRPVQEIFGKDAVPKDVGYFFVHFNYTPYGDRDR